MSTVRSGTASWAGTDLVPSRAARRAIGIAFFAVATALSAKVALPIPGTPVPFTFGPLMVLLSGAVLGRRGGAASQVAYLLAGIAGLPVFAAGGGAAYLLGPTGGYLIAYPLAAYVAGMGADGGALRRLGALLAGLATIFVGGLSWLAAVKGVDMAVVWGLRPFVLFDLAKVGLVAMVAGRIQGRTRTLFRG
jgi:biotin transport system substrate-specific component